MWWSWMNYVGVLQAAGLVVLAFEPKFPNRRRALRALAAASLTASVIIALTGSALTIASDQPGNRAAVSAFYAVIVTVLNVLILGLFGFWAELRRTLNSRRRSSGPPDIESIL
ncbi:hypothetical protein O4159_21840 [Gordonia terrae]|nr:hypothetical protein [Gordonia terrae]